MPLAEPPDEPTFYMTVNANRRQLEPLVSGEKSAPIMRNVMQFQGTDGLLVREPFADRYVLDSGGYTAMDEFGGDFPWSVDEYHDWARQMYDVKPFDWAAVMDLACEPDFDDVLSVDERIDRTVENTIALLDQDPEYPVLPVLQGRTIPQWLECYDALRDHGIDPDHAGIGTLCRQTSGDDIRKIVQAIRTRTDIDAFHGFGVKATAFKQGAQFETADSQAWSWPLKYGIKLSLDDSNPPTMYRTKYGEHDGAVHRETFNAYHTHVSRLHDEAYQDTDDEQTPLSDY